MIRIPPSSSITDVNFNKWQINSQNNSLCGWDSANTISTPMTCELRVYCQFSRENEELFLNLPLKITKRGWTGLEIKKVCNLARIACISKAMVILSIVQDAINLWNDRVEQEMMLLKMSKVFHQWCGNIASGDHLSAFEKLAAYWIYNIKFNDCQKGKDTVSAIIWLLNCCSIFESSNDF
jgi:hypothetical protein